MNFRVTIEYREPTYALRAGTRKEPFKAVFTVEAQTAEDAKEQAVSKFERDGRVSGARWVRSIVSVNAIEAGAAPQETDRGGKRPEKQA